MEHKGELHPQIDRRARPTARFSTSTTCRRRPTSTWRPGRSSARAPLAGQDAARSPKARRTSPAVCRASRKSSKPGKPQGPGRHGRDRRHGRDPGRQAPRQADDRSVKGRRRHREGAPRSRTASSSACTPATTSRPATRSSTARWCRTTSCASTATKRCRATCSPKCRASTAPRTWRSTTSTSRSSSPRCSAR